MNNKSRGFSLVEAAIVLVAFLILMGGLAWPFAQRIRTDQVKSEQAYMEGIRERVLAYASKTRTLPVKVPVRVVTTNFTVTVSLPIPGGRPILPCPDIDGDGIEDRSDGIANNITKFTINIIGTGTTIPEIGLSNLPGRCADVKGELPWRTLGSKPSDYWGQHYTYFVDAMMSHGLFGFDKLNNGSSVLNLLALAAKPCSAGGRSVPNTITGDPFGVSATSPENVYGYPRIDVGWTANPRRVRAVPGVVGQIDSSVPAAENLTSRQLVLAGGFVKALHSAEAFDQRSILGSTGDKLNVRHHCWSQESSLEGVAFAIVSHGRNGYGGINYEVGYQIGDPRHCVSFPGSNTVYVWERINAIRNSSCVSSLRSNNCTSAIARAHPCRQPADTSDYFLFVQEADAFNSSTRTFDDVLVWMMPSEVHKRLASDGALPPPPSVVVVP